MQLAVNMLRNEFHSKFGQSEAEPGHSPNIPPPSAPVCSKQSDRFVKCVNLRAFEARSKRLSEEPSDVPQVIPCAAVTDGRRILLFRRNSSESRLTGQKTFLFGGHLELGETPRAGILRELKEELNGFSPEELIGPALEFRSFADQVSCAHYAIVYIALTTAPLLNQITVSSECKSLEMALLSELGIDELEGWARVSLQPIKDFQWQKM